jgi:hypothetical protein
VYNNDSNHLKAYKLKLLSSDEGIALENQSVVFSGEPPYIITWKKRSYKLMVMVKASDSKSADKLPRLVYAEVSTRELTDIAVLLEGL